MSKNLTPVHLGMYNEFESDTGHRTVNFRNATESRTSTASVEIFDGHKITADLRVKAEDNIAMALSILGVGRVTDEVEYHAADLLNSGRTEEDFTRFAVINLRAALLLREKASKESEKDLDDAFALYKLAYPDAAVTRSEFPDQSMSKFWITNLSKIRKDPTVLGAL